VTSTAAGRMRRRVHTLADAHVSRRARTGAARGWALVAQRRQAQAAAGIGAAGSEASDGDIKEEAVDSITVTVQSCPISGDITRTTCRQMLVRRASDDGLAVSRAVRDICEHPCTYKNSPASGPARSLRILHGLNKFATLRISAPILARRVVHRGSSVEDTTSSFGFALPLFLCFRLSPRCPHLCAITYLCFSPLLLLAPNGLGSGAAARAPRLLGLHDLVVLEI
jgi:hypothetical protein